MSEKDLYQVQPEKPRTEIDVLEEQLLTLQHIQIVLDKIEQSLEKKAGEDSSNL